MDIVKVFLDLSGLDNGDAFILLYIILSIFICYILIYKIGVGLITFTYGFLRDKFDIHSEDMEPTGKALVVLISLIPPLIPIFTLRFAFNDLYNELKRVIEGSQSGVMGENDLMFFVPFIIFLITSEFFFVLISFNGVLINGLASTFGEAISLLGKERLTDKFMEFLQNIKEKNGPYLKMSVYFGSLSAIATFIYRILIPFVEVIKPYIIFIVVAYMIYSVKNTFTEVDSRLRDEKKGLKPIDFIVMILFIAAVHGVLGLYGNSEIFDVAGMIISVTFITITLLRKYKKIHELKLKRIIEKIDNTIRIFFRILTVMVLTVTAIFITPSITMGLIASFFLIGGISSFLLFIHIIWLYTSRLEPKVIEKEKELTLRLRRNGLLDDTREVDFKIWINFLLGILMLILFFAGIMFLGKFFDMMATGSLS